MEIRADDNSNAHVTLNIDNVTLYVINNVVAYKYVNFNTWKIDTSPSEDATPNIYLVIDTEYNMAFGHWILESSLYIHLYHELKKLHPDVKILIDTDLSYKRNMLEYLNVPESDIATTINKNNICYFPKPITALNDRAITDIYREHITIFWQTLHSIPVEKTIDILLLPRQKKENYAPNDRITDTADIETKLSNLPNTCILHTDDTDMKTQIDMVQSAKTIIVTDGSPFSANGFFAKDSKIIILGDITNMQTALFSKLNYCVNIIKQNNTVLYVPYSVTGGSRNHSIFKMEHILSYLQ